MAVVAEQLKLSDLYLLSDVDGTLINHDGTIPQRNIEALNRFVGKGGHFAIATGRSPFWIRSLVEQLPVNAPCVCFNGGMLYNFSTEETVMELLLPDYAKAYADILQQAPFPVGLTVMTKEEYHNVGVHPELNEELMKRRQSEFTAPVPWQSVTDPWYKLLIMFDEKNYGAYQEYAKTLQLEGVRFTETAPVLAEMLPAISSKAYAIDKLMEIYGLRREQMACIGDFYNDLEMLQAAGIPATVQDAPDDIKQICIHVGGKCQDGAVADLVEYLETNYPE
ncbi:HAD family hydrolase [Ruminococcaceae bacterium OttesenSCG-928-L11]|nr:HAD family hydrolase [Ruminococcaceae bacterium OttesenSCG-928-L11]